MVGISPTLSPVLSTLEDNCCCSHTDVSPTEPADSPWHKQPPVRTQEVGTLLTWALLDADPTLHGLLVCTWGFRGPCLGLSIPAPGSLFAKCALIW